MTYYHRLSSLNIHFYFSENFGHKHGWSSCWGVQSSSQASVGLTSFQDPQDLLKCMDTVTVENFLCRTKVTPRTFSTDLTFCSQCYSPCLVASHMPTCIYKASRLAPIFHLWTSDPHLTESGLLRKTFFGYCQSNVKSLFTFASPTAEHKLHQSPTPIRKEMTQGQGLSEIIWESLLTHLASRSSVLTGN